MLRLGEEGGGEIPVNLVNLALSVSFVHCYWDSDALISWEASGVCVRWVRGRVSGVVVTHFSLWAVACNFKTKDFTLYKFTKGITDFAPSCSAYIIIICDHVNNWNRK